MFDWGRTLYDRDAARKNQIAAANVLATDIDTQILAKAKQGLYRDHELRNVSAAERTRFFDAKEKNQFQIKPEIKRRVHFKQHDLLKDPYNGPFDVIVCRNVTIYFKSDARDAVYQKFSDALVGGHFVYGSDRNDQFCGTIRPQENRFVYLSKSIIL